MIDTVLRNGAESRPHRAVDNQAGSPRLLAACEMRLSQNKLFVRTIKKGDRHEIQVSVPSSVYDLSFDFAS
jgi:hypothetical protein